MTVAHLQCAGCGWQAPAGLAAPFRCRHAGEGDVDHVLVHHPGDSEPLEGDDDPNPFYKDFLVCQAVSWFSSSRRLLGIRFPVA